MNTQLRIQAKVPSTPKPSLASVQTQLLQRKCACGGSPGIDGECVECREKRLSLQRRATNPAVEVPPIVYDVLSSPSQPLDAGTRGFMEPRFGHDFSQVRVHTDVLAAESARVVNALAYTVGRDVVFGAGQYEPGTSEGRRLLAHELTHVVQQKNTHDIHAKLVTGLGQDQYELDADRVSEQVTDKIAMRWPSFTYSDRSRPVLQRQVASFAGSSALMAPGAASSPTTSVGCVQPASVQLVRSYPLQFPGYLTGGGICAVMEALPAVNNLCPAGILEEVTLARSGVSNGSLACPGSLLEGFCVGGPPFTPGKSRPRACSGVPIPATGFGDRHSVQLQNISVLHDLKRNPGNLSRCGFTCNQRYYIQAGTAQKTLGRFQIHFELTKRRNITEVTATKTPLGEKGDFPTPTESRRFA